MSVSLNSQRIIHNGVDVSLSLSDFRSGTYAMSYVAGQYIYIGANAPFNNVWIDMATHASPTAGAPVVEVWWNSSWTPVVDVLDQTNGMLNDGRISWSIDILKGWQIETYSQTVGLSGTNIYNRFWLRLSWSGSFSRTLNYVGQKFSDDLVFKSHYPDLMQAQILDGYEAGKTDWQEQHFMAAEMILEDLQTRNIIKAQGEVYDWQKFETTSCHKVASIIMQAMGKAYIESKALADKAYNASLDRKFLNIDSNQDGHLSKIESSSTQGWLSR